MRIGQVEARDPAAGQAAGRGGLAVGLQAERQAGNPQAEGGGRHLGKIRPIPKVAPPIVVRREGTLRRRAADQAPHLGLAPDLACGALWRCFMGVIDPAPIDPKDAARRDFERGIDLPAEALGVGSVHIPLLVVVKAPSRDRVQVFDVLIRAPLPLHGGERDGLGSDPVRQASEQRLLPLQALQLPNAEADQQGEPDRDEKRGGEQSGLSPSLPHGAPQRGVNRPCSALCVYCSAISVALSTLSSKKARIGVSTPHSPICTITGACNLNSTSSAPPSTKQPRMKMANTAGPSPASAKA